MSLRSVGQARGRVGCETYQGSILDADLVARLAGRFDFAVLGAVLHHLVGPTWRALAHSLSLVGPGGHGIVLEPVFSPPWTMDVVFYAKRVAAKLTSRRIELQSR